MNGEGVTWENERKLRYISFQSGETNEDLIICILILLKLNKFCSWYFTTIWMVFLRYIWSVEFIIIYLLKLLLLLRGGYYRGSPHKQLMKVQSYK